MRLALAGAVAAALALAPATAFAAAVDVHFQAFAPSELDVLPGETVEWTNISSRPHTVTADDDSFDSGEIHGGDRFAVTFDTVGSHGYQYAPVQPG